MTKEELIKKITKLESELERLEGNDEEIRKEFAKAFNWSESNPYFHETDYRIPSWYEIFTEIGKLLNNNSRKEIDMIRKA